MKIRPDGVARRCDITLMCPAELAVQRRRQLAVRGRNTLSGAAPSRRADFTGAGAPRGPALRRQIVLLLVVWGLILASLAATARPAEPPKLEITPPAAAVQVGWCVRMPVAGLQPAEYPQTVVVVGPGKAAGADLLAPVNAPPYLHFSSLEPGRYVVAIVIGTRKAQIDVVVGGQQPDPPVPPVPTPGDLWGLVVVHESSQRTPAQAAIYVSRPLQQFLGGQHLQWRLADKDVPMDVATWVQRAGTEGLPKLFLVPRSDGKAAAEPIWEGPLPATDTAVIELVKKALPK